MAGNSGSAWIIFHNNSNGPGSSRFSGELSQLTVSGDFSSRDRAANFINLIFKAFDELFASRMYKPDGSPETLRDIFFEIPECK